MFVELTLWHKTETKTILARADAITLIEPGGPKGTTLIYLTGETGGGPPTTENAIGVKESPEEIIHLIAKAKMLSAIPPMTTMVDAWEQLVMSKE